MRSLSPKNPLIEILEKIDWTYNKEEKKNVMVIITHRGAYRNRKVFPYNLISKHDKMYIYIQGYEGNHPTVGELTPIPLHRIEKIENVQDGSILYSH